jgi:hypothetical protein
MDSESAPAIRDAFLFDVHRQFEGLARWVAPPATVQVWEDGREAVFAVNRDESELICFTVTFDFAESEKGAAGFGAKVQIEQQHKVTGSLVLGWRGSLPEARKGLDSRADYVEGDYGDPRGAVVDLLRDKLTDALGSNTAVVAYEAPSRMAGLPAATDATFDIVVPVAQATTALQASGRPKKAPAATQRTTELDLSLLREVLGGREGSRAVARYLASVKGNLRGGALNEALVAALIEQGMRVHYAVLRAEITGRSVSTGIGVAIKQWSRPAALGVAGLVEFIEGLYGIGPLVGDNYATAGLALVQSVLFGAGLSQVSKPGADKKSWAVLLGAWSVGLTLLVANNPELKHLAQTKVFQLEEPAREALARLKRAKKREGRVEGDVAQSRGQQREALTAPGRGRASAVRSAREEVTEAVGRRDRAGDEIVHAERDLDKALAADPSTKLAFLTLALLFGSVSIGSGLYVARYLSTAEGEHEAALEKKRDNAELKAMLSHVRDQPEGFAGELFGVLKGLYADALQRRGMAAGDAVLATERDFGSGEAVRIAGARFSGKKYKPPKPGGRPGLGS